MEIYYKNETLYVDIEELIDYELLKNLKSRIFRIIDDYGIDRIILNIENDHNNNRSLLKTFEREFRSQYRGDLVIK